MNKEFANGLSVAKNPWPSRKTLFSPPFYHSLTYSSSASSDEDFWLDYFGSLKLSVEMYWAPSLDDFSLKSLECFPVWNRQRWLQVKTIVNYILLTASYWKWMKHCDTVQTVAHVQNYHQKYYEHWVVHRSCSCFGLLLRHQNIKISSGESITFTALWLSKGRRNSLIVGNGGHTATSLLLSLIFRKTSRNVISTEKLSSLWTPFETTMIKITIDVG